MSIVKKLADRFSHLTTFEIKALVKNRWNAFSLLLSADVLTEVKQGRHRGADEMSTFILLNFIYTDEACSRWYSRKLVFPPDVLVAVQQLPRGTLGVSQVTSSESPYDCIAN